jgi:endo-1,4-beta-mannosidase
MRALAALVLLCLSSAAGAFVGADGSAFLSQGRPLALRGIDAGDPAGALRAIQGGGINVVHLRLDSTQLSNVAGVPTEAGWRAVDQVLALAGLKGVKVLLSLSSFRPGGTAQRLSQGLGGASESLYLADGRAREWYYVVIQAALARKNSVNGLAYAQDPALLGWSLAADLFDPADPSGARAVNWVKESAQKVKQGDPRHLVGLYWKGSELPAAGRLADLDFLVAPTAAAGRAVAALAKPVLVVGSDGRWASAALPARPLRLSASAPILHGLDADLAVRSSEAAQLSLDYGLDGLLDQSQAAGSAMQGQVHLKALRTGGRYAFRWRAQSADGRVAASPITWLAIAAPLRQPARPQTMSRNIIRAYQGRFWDGAKPFRYVGANNYYIRYIEDPAAIAEVLDTAQAMGMKVLRCQANGERFEPLQAGLFEPMRWMVAGGPSGFQEAAWRRYDQLVAEAGKRGLRVIIYITDNWEYGGGMKVWTRWRKLGDKNQFYTDPQVKADYQGLIRAWATRVNSVTGIAYKDDPTVFAWELANEPRDEADKSSATLARWADEMARYWKSLDPKHMVAAGIEGLLEENGEHYSGADFLKVQASPAIDFATFHFYPVKDFRRLSLRAARKSVKDYVKMGHEQLKKPVIMEEFAVEKKYEPEINRLEWTQDMAQDFMHAGGDGLNYWMLTNSAYTGNDGFEMTKDDTAYFNMFARLADEVNP